MDVSYRWLGDLIPNGAPDLEEVERRLADRGAPVEGVERVGEGLEGVVAARVREVRSHPDADHLTVCLVDPGSGETVPVVCGAPNVQEGRSYAFAPVGTVLPGGIGQIREVELRGQRSVGMLCSARELGLGTDHTGLLETPKGTEPGAPLLEALGLDDHRLDVEVTANRGDLLSHVGIAREVATGGVAGVRLPDIPGAPELSLRLMQGAGEARGGGATVRIEDPDLCRRYIGVVIRGVSVGPSPAWLQARLRAVGARPINNVVDATNYVLLELGQPLHAFDLDRLEKHTVVVRRPREGEDVFSTLDGEARRLDADMLMICDARRPVAIAGVMGGLHSEVGGGTTDILLECALFDPTSIRSTRRALGMSTDASYRFERGVDPAGMEAAVRRAAEIVLATAGGRCETEAPDCDPRPWSRPEVRLRVSRVEHVLGVRFSADDIVALLEPLGFGVTVGQGGDGGLRVAVPGWRSYDVTREIDLIEEIARSHGYDAFPETLGPYRPGTVPDHPLFGIEDRLRTLMVGRGFFEAQTPAFVPSSEGDVRVMNPVSREEDHLRRSLLPGLFRHVEHNWSRGVGDVRLFEIGTSFRRREPGEPPAEETRIAAVMTGSRTPAHWSGTDQPLDFWDLKALARELHVEVRQDGRLETGPRVEGPHLAEGLVLLDDRNTEVGRAGRVEPGVLDAPPWAGPVWAVELGLPAEPGTPPTPEFRPLPSYPAVERDLALLVPETLPAARVQEAVEASGGALLASVALFDRYRGPGVPEGMRSLAYRMRFQSRERTLTDEDVDSATARIVEHLREELGVETRG